MIPQNSIRIVEVTLKLPLLCPPTVILSSLLTLPFRLAIRDIEWNLLSLQFLRETSPLCPKQFKRQGQDTKLEDKPPINPHCQTRNVMPILPTQQPVIQLNTHRYRQPHVMSIIFELNIRQVVYPTERSKLPRLRMHKFMEPIGTKTFSQLVSPVTPRKL